MTTETRLWVLGAADPEMQAIETLLRECGETVAYAVDNDGKRVHPGNAYRGENFDPAEGMELPLTLEDGTIFEVECAVRPRIEAVNYVTVDHHRPRDPGYGKPPEEFMSASSIGRVIAEIARLGAALSWEADTDYCDDQGHIYVEWSRPLEYMTPSEWAARDIGRCTPTWVISRHPGDDSEISYFLPSDFVLCAAADHCLAAAYRGECPGVDPDALMQWRAKSRAAFRRQNCGTCHGTGWVPNGSYGCRNCGTDDHPDCHDGNRDVCPDCCEEKLLADIESARKVLREAIGGWTTMGDAFGDTCPRGEEGNTVWVADYHRIADLRGQQVPELPEAACREGLAYVTTVTDRDGRVKDVIGGCTTPEMVREWMDARTAEGREVYGDPARGFAGAYKPATA